MSNKQQTAVEWLIDKLSGQPIDDINDEYWYNIFQQAKEMEKQQKMSDYAKGKVNYNSVLNGVGKNVSPEEFYEQEYGGNNERG